MAYYKNKRGHLLSLARFCFFASLQTVVYAQDVPIQDKLGFEKALEKKAQSVLSDLLGPGKVNITVEAQLDFSRTEKMSFDATSTKKETSVKQEPKSGFLWEGSVPADESAQQILPGFPVPARSEAYGSAGGDAQSENRSYERQLMYPPVFVKKLTATVVVDKEVPESEMANIQNIVSSVLGVDPKRGDTVFMMRASFIPGWKKMLYSPGNLDLLFKYGLLSILGILALVVVALSFFKLASALHAMAKTQQVSHQISMQLSRQGMEELPGEPGATGRGFLPGKDQKLLEAGGENAAGGEEPAQQGAEESLIFDVKANQVTALISILAKEEPANIALVANHLQPDVRKLMMDRLPPEVAVQVLVHMGEVRYVGTETIMTLKGELEKRLQGMVGGVDKVLEMLESSGAKAKKEMFAKLEESNPELAAQVRQGILFLDDLWQLKDQDFSLLVSSFKLEDWAYVLKDVPKEVKERVAAQLPKKSAQMIDQLMKFGAAPQDKIDEALDRLLAAGAGLIKEGRITKPVVQGAEPGKTAPKIEKFAALESVPLVASEVDKAQPGKPGKA